MEKKNNVQMKMLRDQDNAKLTLSTVQNKVISVTPN